MKYKALEKNIKEILGLDSDYIQVEITSVPNNPTLLNYQVLKQDNYLINKRELPYSFIYKSLNGINICQALNTTLAYLPTSKILFFSSETLTRKNCTAISLAHHGIIRLALIELNLFARQKRPKI